MVSTNFMKTWAEESAFGVKQLRRGIRALERLNGNERLAAELTNAVGGGGVWDEPFDAVIGLVSNGNPYMNTAWNTISGADMVLGKAVAKHPGGVGLEQLQLSRALTKKASAAIDRWISEGGGPSTLSQLTQKLIPQLEQARVLAINAGRMGT